jgi:hypothetical protein
VTVKFTDNKQVPGGVKQVPVQWVVVLQIKERLLASISGSIDGSMSNHFRILVKIFCVVARAEVFALVQ